MKIKLDFMCLQSDIYTNQRILHKEASKMNGYTENKAARYRLPNKVNATVGAVLKMGDKVLVADRGWKGFIAGVYEFVDTPEETGLDEIECRLNLTAMSQEVFEDGGHAIEWAMLR